MFLLVLVLRAGSRIVKSSWREAESPSAEQRLRCHAESWVTAKAFVNGLVWPTWNRGPGAGRAGARSRCCVSGSSTYLSLFFQTTAPSSALQGLHSLYEQRRRLWRESRGRMVQILASSFASSVVLLIMETPRLRSLICKMGAVIHFRHSTFWRMRKQ